MRISSKVLSAVLATGRLASYETGVKVKVGSLVLALARRRRFVNLPAVGQFAARRLAVSHGHRQLEAATTSAKVSRANSLELAGRVLGMRPPPIWRRPLPALTTSLTARSFPSCMSGGSCFLRQPAGDRQQAKRQADCPAKRSLKEPARPRNLICASCQIRRFRMLAVSMPERLCRDVVSDWVARIYQLPNGTCVLSPTFMQSWTQESESERNIKTPLA